MIDLFLVVFMLGFSFGLGFVLAVKFVESISDNAYRLKEFLQRLRHLLVHLGWNRITLFQSRIEEDTKLA